MENLSYDLDFILWHHNLESIQKFIFAPAIRVLLSPHAGVWRNGLTRRLPGIDLALQAASRVAATIWPSSICTWRWA